MPVHPVIIMQTMGVQTKHEPNAKLLLRGKLSISVLIQRILIRVQSAQSFLPMTLLQNR
ncbi:hypothetical protein BKA69DRAFT_1045620 [Paraphysoderma sedebokerense]|nr:hypothetical protein BKA69DRAFT_1045620 [Paraphysoderma sedebokerense]